jgi:thiol-disulfide isomerase/thioredoxin
MKRLSLPVLFLAGALAAPSLATSSTGAPGLEDEVPAATQEKPKVLKLGSKVPETLKLRDFEGKETSFKQLRGKVTIVHFWSDRCPAEKHANPIFKEMEKKYAGSKDVVMIGIASNQNELGAKPGENADYKQHYVSLRKQRDKVGYKHTILADHGNAVSKLFQAKTTPHCFVIDAKGVLRYSGALDDDPRGRKGAEATNYVVDAVDAVLAGKKPAVEKTKPYG